MDKTEENAEDIKSEIQQEIDDIKSKQTGNLEIEVTDEEPDQESKPEEEENKPKGHIMNDVMMLMEYCQDHQFTLKNAEKHSNN